MTLPCLVYKIFILHRVCSFEKAILLGDFWHTLRKMFWSDINAQIWSSISWTQQNLKIGHSVQNIVQCENLPIFLNISIFLRLRRSDATTLLSYYIACVFRSKFFLNPTLKKEKKVSHSANALIIFFFKAAANIKKYYYRRSSPYANHWWNILPSSKFQK